MGIGDAITIVSCLAGLMVALPAMMLFLGLIFNQTTQRAAERLAYGGIVPFFVGLIPSVLIAVPASILISLGSVPQFCGSVLWLLLLMAAFTGLSVVSRTVGMHMRDLLATDSTLLDPIAGVLIVTFAISFPFLGWFIILPLSLVTGIGALVLAMVGQWFQRAPAPAYDGE